MVRLVVPFPHQDPAVQPGFHLVMGAPYLPGLERAQHALQDIDTALLGIVSPARPGGGVSTARQLTREAVLRIRGFITGGGAL